jgi:dipeptidyl aminopeptidase/acylaminoacyl peptidase
MFWLLLHSALAAPERDHDITPEDYFDLQSVGSFALSPDGAWVVYEQGRWDEALNGKTSDLWRAPLGGGKPERLTFSPGNDHGPAFGDDARFVYHTAAISRDGHDTPPWDGTNQVYRLPLDGGEPVAVTAAPDGVRGFRMAEDDRSLWYLVGSKTPRDDAFATLRSKHGDPVYGHGEADTSELWRLDLDTWRTRQVHAGERTIYAFDVTPDGQRVAMLTTPDSELLWHEGWSQVELLSVDSGAVEILDDALWREQAPSPFGWLDNPRFKPDGTALVFDVGFDGYGSQAFVAPIGPEGAGKPRQIQISDPWSLLGNAAWRSGTDELCFTVADTARIRLVCKPNDGEGTPRVVTPEDDAVVWGWDSTPNGKGLVMNRSGLDHSGDLFLRRGKREVRLTRSNPQMQTWKLPQIKRVGWLGPDGVEVEGVLELPSGWEPSHGPLPTVLQLHGGPTWASLYRFAHRGHGRATFAARGWALITPNYRGSIGYGDAFLDELVGRENDVEVGDILAGVDHLVAQGIADPDKLAVMGWSNGGYLTNCLISRTERFKAAISGAGVFDQTLQWATEDTPGHVINYMEGLPWEKPEEVRRASPLFAADAIRTPTLIHVGEHDPRVPAAHARALFRALNVYLDVPAELVVYPDEGHSLHRYTHMAAKMAWDIAWLDKHVLGVEPSDAGDDENDTED